MSRSYSRVAEGCSFDPTSGESAGNRRNDFREADQERGTHRAGFPAYGADHRDGQGHLEDRSRQRSDPMAALSDQHVDRRDQVRQSVPNHNSRLEVDPRNTTYLHGTHPQESEHSGEDTRFNRPGWLPHSDDTREVMLTLDSNSGGDAFGNQKSYGEQPQYPIPPPAENAIPHGSMSRQELSYYTQLAHQEVSPRIEPCSDWRMDFPIDSNPGWYIDVASAPSEEVEHKEEVPWSSVNLLNQHARIPIAKLNMMADMAGAYETGRASHDSGDALNLVASTAASTGDSEDPDWGVISAATICPAFPAAGNLSDPTGYAFNPFHQGQGQGAFVLPEYPPAGQYNVPMQYPQRQTATQDTSRQTSNHDDGYLQVPASESTSTKTSSPADSTLSGVLYCPSCSSKFEGNYRRGNYGRHRRHKHEGPTRTCGCEDPVCNKKFKRADARLKHYRRHHPELLRGSQ